jgi:hypothetical protein
MVRIVQATRFSPLQPPQIIALKRGHALAINAAMLFVAQRVLSAIPAHYFQVCRRPIASNLNLCTTHANNV